MVIVLIDKAKHAIFKYKIDQYAKNTKKGFVQKTKYESKRSESDILIATIPSDIISENVLAVFVKNQDIFKFKNLKEDTIKRNLKFNGNQGIALLEDKSKRLQDVLTLNIDQHPVGSPNWLVTVHPQSLEKEFICYLNIRELSANTHFLTVEIKRDTLLNEVKRDSLLANIPFYKAY
jgi:hypothetical protein